MKHLFRLLFVVVLVAIPLTGIFAQDDATIADAITTSANNTTFPEFGILLETIQATDLLDTLSGDGPYILFAPTDEAFEDFFDATEMDKDAWLAVPEVLKEILLYHIAESDKPRANLVATGEIVTLLEGSTPIVVTKEKKYVVLDGFANVVDGPDEVSNGVIYTIDSVLVPPGINGDQASGEACVISAPDKNTVAVRVGPGENRTSVVFLAANTDFEVSGRFVGEDKSVWYKLNPAEAAPGRAINEAWVSADGLDETGDCEAVGDAAAPPIIPITSSQPNPPGGGDSGGTAPSQPGALPQTGRWTGVLNPITNASCAGTGNVPISTSEIIEGNTFTAQVSQVSADRIIMDGDVFAATGGGTYTGKWSMGSGLWGTMTLHVVSSTVITGDIIASFDNCSATVSFTMSR